jgi:hypothetical protein
MTDTDHLIWSNYHLDYEDWKEDLESEYPDFSEEDRYLKMLEINNDYLDDERVNLNIQLSQPILILADWGFGWGTPDTRRSKAAISWMLVFPITITPLGSRQERRLRCDVFTTTAQTSPLSFFKVMQRRPAIPTEEKIFMGTATRADITV